MHKKLFINVYSSPYVDMVNEDKIKRKEKPLPILKFTLVKSTVLNAPRISNMLIDAAVNCNFHNQITNIYEGTSCVYADLLVQDTSDFNQLKSKMDSIDDYALENDYDKKETKEYIRISTTEGCNDLDTYLENETKAFSSCYKMYNLGASWDEWIQLISIIVQVSDQYGGIPNLIKQSKYYVIRNLNLVTKKYKDAVVLDAVKFSKELSQYTKTDYKDIVIWSSKKMQNRSGFTIKARCNNRIYTVKTNLRCKIISCNSEPVDFGV